MRETREPVLERESDGIKVRYTGAQGPATLKLSV